MEEPVASDVPATTEPSSLAEGTSGNERSTNAAQTASTIPSVLPNDDYSADVHELLHRRDNVQRTNINYDLYYIDGYPYLIKAADRQTRSSRRPRAAHENPNSTGRFTNTSAIVRQTMLGSTSGTPTRSVRHHQVDLPATAAMPVRMADGGRALILSPEGVRAMAAQGVNVETSNPARVGLLGLNAAIFRQYVRLAAPNLWLIAKLAFLVLMLGSNSSWYRFFVLNAIATAIFLWQSGLIAALLGNAPTNQGTAAPGVANAARPAAPVSGPLPQATENQAQQSTTTDAAVADNTAHVRETPLLHDLGRAFLSSIVPSLTPPVRNVPQAREAPRPETAAAERTAVHDPPPAPVNESTGAQVPEPSERSPVSEDSTAQTPPHQASHAVADTLEREPSSPSPRDNHGVEIADDDEEA